MKFLITGRVSSFQIHHQLSVVIREETLFTIHGLYISGKIIKSLFDDIRTSLLCIAVTYADC